MASQRKPNVCEINTQTLGFAIIFFRSLLLTREKHWLLDEYTHLIKVCLLHSSMKSFPTFESLSISREREKIGGETVLWLLNVRFSTWRYQEKKNKKKKERERERKWSQTGHFNTKSGRIFRPIFFSVFCSLWEPQKTQIKSDNSVQFSEDWGGGEELKSHCYSIVTRAHALRFEEREKSNHEVIFPLKMVSSYESRKRHSIYFQSRTLVLKRQNGNPKDFPTCHPVDFAL